MDRFIVYLLALLVLIASELTVSAAETCPARPFASSCSLYLANSTINGGGVGIFTTLELFPADVVGYGDLMSPFIDLYWHRRIEYENQDHPFFDYVWQGMGPAALESADSNLGSVVLMAYGLDAAINCHLGLVNTHSASIEYDDYHSRLLHRSRDPGAGAFTPYLSGATQIANPIPAGGELFKHYGDDWFVRRTHEFGLVPLSNDYSAGDILIQKFARLFPEARNVESLQDVHKDLWDLMANFPYESRITNAIPTSHEHIPLALQDGIWEPYIQDARRDIRELQQQGRCLENISHGPSTLKQAGRGAFSTTFLRAGSIITGSPLLHLKNDDFFEMSYQFDQEVTPGYQISMNYCWKHPQSTMLLCPYGAAVNFINHNQTLANVKVRWATHGHIGHDDTFLKRSFSEIFKTFKTHLAFDYVALRDIQDGEELFLDYGNEWERAWQDHVSKFYSEKLQPFDSMMSSLDLYKCAHDLNRELEDCKILTDDEQQSKPYPANVQLRCHSQVLVFDWIKIVPLNDLRSFSWNKDDVGLPCQVLNVHEHSFLPGLSLYHVGIDAVEFANNDEKVSDNAFIEWCVEVDGIPRNALKFFDKPYTTDLHLRDTFRNPIGIPDHLFPAAWKAFSN